MNNEELIGYAKNRGYKIIFKPHPNLAKFIHLFDLDESIIADDKKTYRELFNESELLITDYSSVAFDFSYLKKPVIINTQMTTTLIYLKAILIIKQWALEKLLKKRMI